MVVLPVERITQQIFDLDSQNPAPAAAALELESIPWRVEAAMGAVTVDASWLQW